MLSLTRRPGEFIICSISHTGLRAMVERKERLELNMLCTRILGNKATFALDIPACMEVRREEVTLDDRPFAKSQFALYAVEVVLSSETKEVRWLSQRDVYPFSVPPSDEPILFGVQAHAIQHTRLVSKFVPAAVQAHAVPVLVTVQRREDFASCAGS